jgi:hypothetical protein
MYNDMVAMMMTPSFQPHIFQERGTRHEFQTNRKLSVSPISSLQSAIDSCHCLLISIPPAHACTSTFQYPHAHSHTDQNSHTCADRDADC